MAKRGMACESVVAEVLKALDSGARLIAARE